MLSSVLTALIPGIWCVRPGLTHQIPGMGVAAKQAIAVNVEIMRVFVRLRQLLAANDRIAKRLDEFERQVGIRFASHEQRFRDVFEAIRQLIDAGEDDGPPSRIGFDTSGKATS